MSSRFGLKSGNYKGEVKDWWSHDKIGPVCGCRPCLNRCQVFGFLVGERGFEPPAPASRRQCSTRLSYSPTAGIGCDPARQRPEEHPSALPPPMPPPYPPLPLPPHPPPTPP